MKRITTATLFVAFLTSCIAQAHPNPPVRAHAHKSYTTHQAHHSPHATPHVMVRAWVWKPGHYRSNGVWIRGTWEIQTVERYLLSRHPSTYKRWIKGRRRPARPAKRHNHKRRHR